MSYGSHGLCSMVSVDVSLNVMRARHTFAPRA